ncbi:MAG TPA: dephospho-CoA kinase [Vicinamibacterales bacterium]|jgi:dephospho-CoA kinase|nr:dephospho-CoA kinase [Vicinamibacterales bacterium]
MDMLRIALTGGIATGKSYCTGGFARLGVPVIDADVLAREAVAPGTRGLDAVAARFGPEVLRADGSLDRAALGRIVFTEARARRDLEAIIHPDVYRRIREWFANIPPGTRLAIADIPLLFETGQQHEFDAVIVCACTPAEQLKRVIARDGLSEADARARIAAQLPIEEKAARADHVIWTDRGFAETDAQVRTVFELLNAL